ncbi:hypothetical protein P170DRAFT_455027 [Aspergillus steynii IBT 23096]|uniref:Uncharacterized protein n=1 Tax=Aspergillus steynii IBT 23096 TaxID=1392250 RepID=A0A2I2GCB9_9EURO|nr:uncharacterized protein P170DRAFT_455027 [Aspergillus steynii IBT 23096]PLB50528.1 hypothetical protein P170DRAFT_455027 [Aspergillus steynii IBT 23096]
MSAMTGPRSPSSPWPPESSNLQLAGHSTTAPLFPLRDSHASPRSPGTYPQYASADCPGSGYFSFSVDNSANTRSRDAPSFSQAAPGSTSQSVHQKKMPDAEHCAELLGSCQHDVMLLDVRPYAHFAKRNIKGSLNLCIPTTLLKRPSFNTQKLENTFTDESDRRNFAKWRQCRYIAVYDAATSDIKDALPLVNVLKKFTVEGWDGEGLVLLGGFNTFSDRFPGFIQKQSPVPENSSKPSSMHLNLPSGAPISGGCALPDASRPAIPFFGNIRQHMDLLGGVGQIPLQLPKGLTEAKRKMLPAWLRKVADPADKGLNVSEKFLDLEKRELERMEQALSYSRSAESPSVDASSSKFRVAGIEKGTKNRYNDVYPFDHTRVKLQDVPRDGCDYVNANYMKAEYSDKFYIATQAPVPDTFNDFWRVIWEQDVRLIVSLTAEIERGQVKCHPYWKSGSYGPFQIHNFAQKYIYMDSPGLEQVDHGPKKSSDSNEDSENSCIISKQLFRVLVGRAYRQLYGAQFRAHCTKFQADEITLDAKASSFAPDDQILALVLRGQEGIHIFEAESGGLRHKAQLKLSLDQPGKTQVLRTAFDGDDGVYVLQSFTPAVGEDDLEAEHPFVRQALQSSAGGGQIYLARHSFRSPHDPVRVCAFPDQSDYRPLALSAAHRDTFAISWQHVREHDDYEVILYNALAESRSDDGSGTIELNYNSCVLVDGSRQRLNPDYLQARVPRSHLPHERGPVIDLAFNDRSSQLLYYYRAQTLYGSFQRINMSSFPVQPTLYDNSCLVRFSDSLSLLFSIAIPFFGTHSTHTENGRSLCQWKYLAFGIATHRAEDWTVACLLKSESVCQSRNCGHVMNLERGRRFPEWTVVARLWGFQNSTNSLGCIVAASKGGTRVAVANWKVLYVWALEPGALIDQNGNEFYPLSAQSGSSKTIEIRPVVLPLDAVCFKLQFMHNEDELIAFTDRGVMHWNFHPSGRGLRITERLDIKTD